MCLWTAIGVRTGCNGRVRSLGGTGLADTDGAFTWHGEQLINPAQRPQYRVVKNELDEPPLRPPILQQAASELFQEFGGEQPVDE